MTDDSRKKEIALINELEESFKRIADELEINDQKKLVGFFLTYSMVIKDIAKFGYPEIRDNIAEIIAQKTGKQEEIISKEIDEIFNNSEFDPMMNAVIANDAIIKSLIENKFRISKTIWKFNNGTLRNEDLMFDEITSHALSKCREIIYDYSFISKGMCRICFALGLNTMVNAEEHIKMVYEYTQKQLSNDNSDSSMQEIADLIEKGISVSENPKLNDNPYSKSLQNLIAHIMNKAKKDQVNPNQTTDLLDSKKRKRD